MVTASNEEELGKALKNNESAIEIEVDLQKKILKIRATEKATWALCATAIGVAAAAVTATIATGGTASPATVPSALVSVPVVTTTLGLPTAISAVMIAVFGGGIASLNKLRSYRMERTADGRMFLYKK